MNNSKAVERWWVTEYPGGCYILNFKTKSKWCNLTVYNDTLYEIWEDGEEDAFGEGVIQKIPDFLPRDVLYHRADSMNKDIITVIFVPVRKDNGRIILESKTLQP